MYDAAVETAYRRLVRNTRAVVAIPLAAATIGLLVAMLAGGRAEMADGAIVDKIASVVIGTSAFAVIVGIALTADALRTLKGLELQQFVKDVIGVRSS